MGDRTNYQADGEEHPGGPEPIYLATWRGPRVLEIAAKLDGQVLGQRTYEASTDGQTLKITTSGRNPNGGETTQLMIVARR